MFQRARSEEQREARRQAILAAAAAMLTEMPVADVTLNELSRRSGLAKSNVLRYFESREEVFLELLDRSAREWLADLKDTFSRDTNENAAVLIADSLVERSTRIPVWSRFPMDCQPECSLPSRR